MLAVDATVLVRFLVDDHPQSEVARELIATNTIFIPSTALIETEWVLRNGYGVARIHIVRAFLKLITLENLVFENPEAIGSALELAEMGMDFANALHLTAARHCEGMLTFDTSLSKDAILKESPSGRTYLEIEIKR